MTMTAITFDDMRKGCWDRDERVKDLAAQPHRRLAALPDLPPLLRPDLPRGQGQGARPGLRAGQQRLDGRGVVRALGRRTTSRSASSRCGMPSWPRPRPSATPSAACAPSPSARCPPGSSCPASTRGYWDPLWQVCNDYGVTVCMHVGSSSSNPVASPDSNKAVGVTLGFNNAIASLADWLFSGNLLRFPKLKLAYSEGQIGWIPYILERADTVWENHDTWTGAKEAIPVPPSTPVLRPHLRVLHRRPPRPATRSTRWARTTSASRPTTPTPTRRGRTPRPTSRSCARGSTTTLTYKILRGNAIQMLDLDRV